MLLRYSDVIFDAVFIFVEPDKSFQTALKASQTINPSLSIKTFIVCFSLNWCKIHANTVLEFYLATKKAH